MMRQPIALAALSLLAAAAALLGASTAAAQEAGVTATAEVAKPLVTVESVTVEPAAPGPDTLCRLRVTVKNEGTETASQLGFRVTINGQELAVYGNQLFMYPVAAKASAEIPLYNFWSTETSRAMPKDGKMTVEVTLKEARWMKIADDEEGVEVWTPLGDVEGLPAAKSVTLAMKKAA